MARTDETTVRDIYSSVADGTGLSVTAVEFFIEAAHDTVEDYLVGEGLGFSEDRLARIEALLACHGIAAPDPTAASEAVGDQRTEYEGGGLSLEGIRETRFGRRAVMLSNGALGNVGEPAATLDFFGASHDSHGR